MYYEEAEVKKYTTKNKKTGAERTSFQINIKKDSKFREPKPIGLIDVSELEKIDKLLKANPIEEKELELNEVKKHNLQLNKEVDELKSTTKSLASDVHKLKEEKIQLQEELSSLQEQLLNEKDKNKNVISIGKYEAKVEELSKEKDTSKTLLLALYSYEERSLINGFLNRTPELAKQILKENPKPIETNVKPSEE